MRFLILFSSLLVLLTPAWAARITAGPMPGHATSHTAQLWLQADGAAELRLEYWPAGRPREPRRTAVLALSEETDYSAQVRLTALDPNSRYLYAVYLDGERQLPGQELQFRTLPEWKGLRPPEDFTVYLGSCALAPDRSNPAADANHEDEQAIFGNIAGLAAGNEQPNFMLWLGDNVYFSHADLESPWAMNARYRSSRGLPQLQPLLRATRHYAVWDDHDYGPNDGNRSFVHKDASLDLFRRYWANPGYGLRDFPGIFTTFSFLDADFFILDDRFYRASDATAEAEEEFNLVRSLKDYVIGYNTATQVLGRRFRARDPIWLGEGKSLFGPGQIDWLKQALIQSTATFKVVVSGSQLFNDLNGFEGWQNFPEEREPFLQWLGKQAIPGVVFISGDRHHTELIRKERKKDYPLYELTCSPLSAAPHTPTGPEAENPQRVKGTLVTQRNFCSLYVHGPADARILTLRAFDSRGRKLWEQSVTAAQLQPPGKGQE